MHPLIPFSYLQSIWMLVQTLFYKTNVKCSFAAQTSIRHENCLLKFAPESWFLDLHTCFRNCKNKKLSTNAHRCLSLFSLPVCDISFRRCQGTGNLFHHSVHWQLSKGQSSDQYHNFVCTCNVNNYIFK